MTSYSLHGRIRYSQFERESGWMKVTIKTNVVLTKVYETNDPSMIKEFQEIHVNEIGENYKLSKKHIVEDIIENTSFTDATVSSFELTIGGL